ncbi:hypothetical protein ACFSS8_15475 [Paracoccus kondratievae]
MTNTGTVTLSGGTIAGALDNSGEVVVSDDSHVDDLVNNENGQVTISADQTLTVDSVVLNAGVISLSGRLDGSVETSGTGRLGLSGGVLDGSLTNGGLLSGTGRITGTVSNTGTVRADQDELRVGGLTNGGQVEIAAGGTLRSDSQVQNDRDLSIDGRLIGGCRTRRRATR